MGSVLVCNICYQIKSTDRYLVFISLVIIVGYRDNYIDFYNMDYELHQRPSPSMKPTPHNARTSDGLFEWSPKSDRNALRDLRQLVESNPRPLD